jgi:hypothetical protein
MIEQRTRVIGVSQAEERVDYDNTLHQRRSDQSEQQRDNVVKVVCPRWKFASAGRTIVLCANVQICLSIQCSTESRQRSISACCDRLSSMERKKCGHMN